MCDVITHACPKVSASLTKPPLKLGTGWVTTLFNMDVVIYPYFDPGAGLALLVHFLQYVCITLRMLSPSKYCTVSYGHV